MSSRRKEETIEQKCSKFVRFHLSDNGAFAPFTGTDFAAWPAFLHLVVLWGRTRSPDVVTALRSVVHCAQIRNVDVMAVFKKSIPCLLDWGDERTLWQQIGPAPTPSRHCSSLTAIISGVGSVLWPCGDGPRICSHVNSKPSKKHPGWFVCQDKTCRDEWRPDPDALADRDGMEARR